MKKLIFSIISTLIIISANAQYQVETGARQGAMAGTGLVLGDIWSSYHNQAGLADITGLSMGLFYSSVFNTSELRESAFAFAFPTQRFGSVGINYTFSGSSGYNFNKFGLAYAMKLGKHVSAGIQLDYFLHTQQNYGNTSAATGELGIIAEPIENLFLGIHVFNPWRAKYNEIEEYLESIFRIGTGYYFSDKALLMFELEKEIDQDLLYRGGVEYQLLKGLFLRAGASLNPVNYTFGLGYAFKGIALDVSYINHEFLGYYMQFGLAYGFTKVIQEEGIEEIID